MMKAYTKDLAWSLAFGLLDADVEHDDGATERAGYPLYTAKEGYAQVADLGERLEVTDSKSNTVNIWIVDETTPVEPVLQSYEEGRSEPYLKARSDFFAKHSDFRRVVQTSTNGIVVTEVASNGHDWLCEHYVHEGRMDYWTSEDQTRRSLYHNQGQHTYQRKVAFLRNEGFRFKDSEELEKAWERREKLNQGGTLTWEEFKAEAQIDPSDEPSVQKLYDYLLELIEGDKLHPKGMMKFRSSCKKASETLEAIQTVELSREEYRTNTCLEVVSEEEAKVHVNGEFGFEVGAMKIHGIPCFDTFDYNFIRFECKYVHWVMIDGELYREYI